MIDYTKLAFASTLRYMRIYRDYELPPGGGTISHNLDYVPYFIPRALEGGDDFVIPIRTGPVTFPSGDVPSFIIEATNSSITITEDFAPTNPTTYYIRVYEDTLP